MADIRELLEALEAKMAEQMAELGRLRAELEAQEIIQPEPPGTAASISTLPTKASDEIVERGDLRLRGSHYKDKGPASPP